jgi:hypothetical protein
MEKNDALYQLTPTINLLAAQQFIFGGRKINTPQPPAYNSRNILCGASSRSKQRNMRAAIDGILWRHKSRYHRQFCRINDRKSRI